MRVDLNSRLNYVNFRANKKFKPNNRRNVGEQQMVQSDNNNDSDTQKIFVQPVVVLIPTKVKKKYVKPEIEVFPFEPVNTVSSSGGIDPGDEGTTPDDDKAPRRNPIWNF